MPHQRQGFTNKEMNWSRELDRSNPQDSFVATNDDFSNGSTFQYMVINHDPQISMHRGTSSFHHSFDSRHTSTSDGNSQILSDPPAYIESASCQTKICQSYLVPLKIFEQSQYSGLYHQKIAINNSQRQLNKRKNSFHSHQDQNNGFQPTQNLQWMKTQFQVNHGLSPNQSYSSERHRTQFIPYYQYESEKQQKIMDSNTKGRQQIYMQNKVDNKIKSIQMYEQIQIDDYIRREQCVKCSQQFDNKYGRFVEQKMFICAQCSKQHAAKSTQKMIHAKNKQNDIYPQKKQAGDKKKKNHEKLNQYSFQNNQPNSRKKKQAIQKNNFSSNQSQSKINLISNNILINTHKISTKSQKVHLLKLQNQNKVQTNKKCANVKNKQALIRQNKNNKNNSSLISQSDMYHSSLIFQNDMFFEKEDLINIPQLSKIQHIEDSIGRSFDNQNRFNYEKSSFSHFLNNHQFIQSGNEQPLINQSNPNISKTITQNSDFFIELITTKTMKINKKNSLLISQQINTRNVQFYSTYEEIPFNIRKTKSFFNQNNNQKNLPLYNHPNNLCQNCMKTQIPQSFFFCDHCEKKFKINSFLDYKKISYNQKKLDERRTDNLLQMLSSFSSFPNVCQIILDRSNLLTHQGLKDLHRKLKIIKDPLKIQHLKDWMTSLKITTLAEHGLKFPSLEEIYLRDNKIKDAGLQVLAENGLKFPNLKEIYLQDNQITDAGLQLLAENGQKLPSLKVIDAQKNQATDGVLQATADFSSKIAFKIGLFVLNSAIGVKQVISNLT